MIWKGRKPAGEAASTLLTEQDVRTILSDTERTHLELAQTFGVSKSTIGKIKTRKNWKHVKETA